MRSLALGAVALSLLAEQGANAAGFAKARRGNGYLAVPIGTVDKPKHLTRRQDGEPLLHVLDNMEFFYSAEIEFGEPPQTVTVLVDTGSSELWINPDCETAPSTEQTEQCEDFGHYNPRRSTTPPIGPFGSEEIHYGDPTDESTLTSVEIVYYADTITIGGAEIKNQTFGVVSSSEGQSSGIFGLAPDMTSGFDGDEPYSLVLHSMYEQGVISGRNFALDLRHAEAETGAVIYGGIDRNKFIGTLEKRPVIRGQGGEYRLGVEMATMGITLDGNSSNYELRGDDRGVMLDSGTTITRLHPAAAQPIYDALDALEDEAGYFYVDCDMQKEAGSADFGFGNKTIRVPFSDFILDIGDPTYCLVGVVTTSDQQILGDTVLRAGYFVFDWDEEAIHVGQAANCGDDDIVAVGKGEASVQDVKGNCDESDAIFDGSPTTSAAPSQTSGSSDSTNTSDSGDGDDGGDNANETDNGEDDGDDGGSAGAHVQAVAWMLMTCVGAGVLANLL